MSPVVRLAEKRWEGRGATHHFYDEMVFECEQAFGFRVHPDTGKSYAPENLIEGRQRAWHRLARAHIQMRNAELAEQRKRQQRANLSALLEQTATLAARQARRDALVELVAPADIEAAETELPSTDLVSPLGERGPPCVRATASDSGHGLSVALGKVPAMTGSKIVPTGRSGGDG